MPREGSHFRVQEGIESGTRIGKMFRKFSHNPTGGIQYLTDAMIFNVSGEEVSVLQDGNLIIKEFSLAVMTPVMYSE